MKRYSMIAAGFGLLVATPAAAEGFQEIVDFEDLALGETSFTVHHIFFDIFVSGGTVVELNPASAHSGTHAYQGNTITISWDDPFDFSLPALGAWVTSGSAVKLQTKYFNEHVGAERPYITKSSSAAPADEYLVVGSDEHPRYITSAIFSVPNDKTFTMDDLTLGLVDVSPGIPEPASWALMLSGFGLVGGMLRARAKERAPACETRPRH